MARCNTNNQTGNLYADTAQISDPLPAGFEFVSASPTPTSAPTIGTNGTVTWDFTWNPLDPASMPAGCQAGATGTNTYEITVVAPTASVSQIPNTVTWEVSGPEAGGGTVTEDTQATRNLLIVADPAGSGGPGIAKSSVGPLAVGGLSGNQYRGTYAGDWVSPVSATPATAVSSAAGQYQTTVTYGLVDTYETAVYDPLPCLDNVTGATYSSAAYNAAPCANPAFHVQRIRVTSAGFDAPNNGVGAAVVTDGWAPEVILTDGSAVTLTATGSPTASSNEVYFSVPPVNVGDVATVVLPPSPRLKNASLVLRVWGYADASVVGPAVLHNTSTAVPYLSGTPGTAASQSADLYVLPSEPQLGISKSFGNRGAGPGGTTVMTMRGGVASPGALANDVVLTDLLPLGLTWTNPAATGAFTLTSGTASVVANPVITVTPDYAGTGRDLIRVHFAAADFPGPGTWTITPPNNFFLVNTPTQLGVYNNTNEIFLFGFAPQQISDQCTNPTQTSGGTSNTEFRTANPLDLAGDGQLNEGHCQAAASLSIFGTGAAFSLHKTVQGDLDAGPKGALGVGSASPGGTGTFGLNWTNVGGDTLNNVVVYDIFPYVGDTGISQGQSGVARDSEFAPEFVGVTMPLPTGVTVEYSQSTNPCRDEVYPDSANPTCDADWTSVLPSPPSLVKALRFFSPDNYTPGQGFALEFVMTVPEADVNKVAWNSAATYADDVTSPGTIPLPAEPPKVGIMASNVPGIVTTTSAPTVHLGDEITDHIVVTGTGGQPGTLEWWLVGPVAPVNGACTAVDWTGAPVVDTGTEAINGDTTLTAGPVAVNALGCYSWVVELDGPNYPDRAVSPAGTPGEVTQVIKYAPSVATTATKQTGPPVTLGDEIVVTGTGVLPTSMTWTLYGPVASNAGSCTSAQWSGAPVHASGSIAVPAVGTFTTPRSTVTVEGCYTFGVVLAETADADGFVSAPGLPSETLFVSAAEVGAGGVTPPPTPGPGSGSTLPRTGGFVFLAAGIGVGLISFGVPLVERARRR